MRPERNRNEPKLIFHKEERLKSWQKSILPAFFRHWLHRLIGMAGSEPDCSLTRRSLLGMQYNHRTHRNAPLEKTSGFISDSGHAVRICVILHDSYNIQRSKIGDLVERRHILSTLSGIMDT